MSWRKSNVTHASATGDIWVNTALGLVLWYEQSKWRMRPYFNDLMELGGGVGLRLTIDGAYYKPAPYLVNSRQMFYDAVANGGNVIYSVPYVQGWSFTSFVIVRSFLANLTEWIEDTVYYGTEWWANTDTTPIGTYAGRGSKRGTADRIAAWETFSGWTSASLVGDYAAEGSATGTKHFGWILLNCDSVYWCENAGRYNSRPTHQLIGAVPASYPAWLWYNGTAWVSSAAVGSTSAPYRVGGAAAAGTYSDPSSVLDPIVITAYSGTTNATYRTIGQNTGTLYLGNIAACL